MNSWFVSSLVILLFILIGGYFSASEIALVSLREGQVRRLAEGGKRGRAVARLREDPSRFLSAVQIGVTFAGFLAARRPWQSGCSGCWWGGGCRRTWPEQRRWSESH